MLSFNYVVAIFHSSPRLLCDKVEESGGNPQEKFISFLHSEITWSQKWILSMNKINSLRVMTLDVAFKKTVELTVPNINYLADDCTYPI